MEKQQMDEPLNFEKIWIMFQETNKKFKETDKFLTEKFQDTDKKFQETDKLLTEKFQDTDKKFQETDKLLTEKFQDTDKKIKELSELFTGHWGKLVEALLGPNCIKLFQELGLSITQTQENVKSTRGGFNIEIDVLLVNETEAVVIEIKTTAKVSHIKELTRKLEQFKTFFPRYSDCKIYGAIAALKYHEQSDKYAESKGLFVIKSKGEGLLEIKNSPGFKPKSY